MAKPLESETLLKLFSALQSGIDPKMYNQDLAQRTIDRFGKDWAKDNAAIKWNDTQAKIGTKLADITSPDHAATGSDLGFLAKTYVGQHPFQTAGLAGLGLTNLGGLTDNDKFGGQLAGLGLGGLVAHNLIENPMLKAAVAMGGGTLGSLFDKLRAKKEQEDAMSSTYRR